jgi:hypothetical protein
MLTYTKFVNLENSPDFKKSGSSHLQRLGSSHSQNSEVQFFFLKWEVHIRPNLEVHFRRLVKFTFAEFRSSEGCCITKHENLKFTSTTIEVHIIIGSSLRAKRQTQLESSIRTGGSSQYFQKFNCHHREVRLPPYRNSLPV